MITDMFAADAVRLRALNDDGLPHPSTHGLRSIAARDVDPVSLAVLEVLLTDVAVEEAVAEAVRTPAQEAPDLYAGPVLTFVNAGLVRALPAVDDAALEILATDWIANGELAGAQHAAVVDWLTAARSLFRDAAAKDRLICVWNCL
ncbi:hypothetical protein [Phytomonospora endophytica]|uniref:Uncharacterized protein n=1 Tax=Phytomonospora endophytica TaxID=714109 RepID=A0A841FPA5_9ACTN|nr:hypothetical protein [Phytomonospora endophytica]MBB6039141.1 hypothetical protein [Phytomonospora endophytica]GIG67622.1 hypothetical protein Pen01_39170 [Phytomonospora endophytica]